MIPVTSLQFLLANLRSQQSTLQSSQINFGWTDNLEPPYATVYDYTFDINRDTINGVRNVHFSLTVIGANVDQAEKIAYDLNEVLDQSQAITPQCMMCLLESWETGQVNPNNLYQVGVKMSFLLQEDMGKAT